MTVRGVVAERVLESGSDWRLEIAAAEDEIERVGAGGRDEESDSRSCR